MINTLNPNKKIHLGWTFFEFLKLILYVGT
jgi:hypothetical protein